MTYEEFDKRCDELENATLQERKTFFADVLAGETEKTDVRMMAFFRYALLFYRGGDFLAAREILEPFIIDYKSYRYRPEIIACFNLVGVVAYYVQEYALSRFYIREGLKIAREHSEVSRYAYEYNNLAVTYLPQQDYERALEAIREAEKNLPVSDEVMHAYIYRNLAEICCHLDRLDEAKDALAKCLANRGREILPEEVRIVNTLLTYKSGDTAGYKRCCAELRSTCPSCTRRSSWPPARCCSTAAWMPGTMRRSSGCWTPWTLTCAATPTRPRSVCGPRPAAMNTPKPTATPP